MIDEQFTTTEDATKAKEATDGGKLDTNVTTVEYVAQRRRDDDRRGGYRGDRDRGYRGGRRDYRRREYDRDRDYDRHRSPPRGGWYNDSYDDRRGRSCSCSPIRYRSRSHSPPGRRYCDDRGGRGRYDRDSPRDHDVCGYR